MPMSDRGKAPDYKYFPSRLLPACQKTMYHKQSAEVYPSQYPLQRKPAQLYMRFPEKKDTSYFG